MILVLRHEPFEDLGHFAEALEAHGVSYTYRDPGQLLSLDDSTGVIIMGGTMSVNDPLPWLASELSLIDDALKARLPLLGICLGSQLIAKALGVRVYPNSEIEIGWAPVHFTEAAHRDRVFGDVDSPVKLFHWHSETFDLPAGAELLACSDKTRHQAYRYGLNVYGLQFHPEVTAPMIADWCTQPVNCGDVSALDNPIDPLAADTGPLAHRIMSRWLGLVSG